MTTRPVAVRVSAATRLYGSCSRQASRMASETWSAILSGWPSVTDSEVKRKRSLNVRLLPIEGTKKGLACREAWPLKEREPQQAGGALLDGPLDGNGETRLYRQALAWAVPVYGK